MSLQENAARNAQAEAAAVLLLWEFDGWACAVDVAALIGAPWRRVAFALRRLAGRGVVLERVIAYRHSANEKGERREFMLPARPETAAPGVLPEKFFPVARLPPPQFIRRVAGRYGISDGDLGANWRHVR